MHIAYVAPHSANFATRAANRIHVMRMCEAFVENGDSVTLVVSGGEETKTDIFEYYGMGSSFEIHQIEVPQVKGKKLHYALRASRAVASLKPDLVVGRCTRTCALTALKGIPTVYDAHQPVWGNFFEFLFYLVLRNNENLVRMTTNSRALKEMFEKNRLAPRCGITVANNGSLASPLEDFPDNWPGRGNSFQVGYLGHLYPGRGVEIIISCAEGMPDVDFHVVGGTEKDISYWKSAANLPNLFFHGFVKHADTYKYRNRCDALLAPYQEKVAFSGGTGDQSKYMNPIKIFEYMSSRQPIICSDLPVLHEVLEHDRNALFCAPGDPGEWQLAINRLRSDPNLGKRLAAVAYEDFINCYTWKARAAKMTGQSPRLPFSE